MDELDEILEKEEELYDDLIDEKDKQRHHRHPLFVILAIIALIAIVFFAIHYFLLYYPGWLEDTGRPNTRSGCIVMNYPTRF